MNLHKILSFVIIVSVYLIELNGESYFTIHNFVRFPYGAIQAPFMGMFLALSLPLELDEINVFFSYNIEANYELPQNESELMYPPLVERSLKNKRVWDRKYFYDVLEFKIKSHGYSGKNCLLRAICETSLYTMEHTGILGDLLHILLTPSTSKNENLLEDYGKAERYAKVKKNCDKYEKKCSISFVDLISTISNYAGN